VKPGSAAKHVIFLIFLLNHKRENEDIFSSSNLPNEKIKDVDGEEKNYYNGNKYNTQSGVCRISERFRSVLSEFVPRLWPQLQHLPSVPILRYGYLPAIIK
jgi:hypothetical protein